MRKRGALSGQALEESLKLLIRYGERRYGADDPAVQTLKRHLDRLQVKRASPGRPRLAVVRS